MIESTAEGRTGKVVVVRERAGAVVWRGTTPSGPSVSTVVIGSEGDAIGLGMGCRRRIPSTGMGMGLEQLLFFLFSGLSFFLSAPPRSLWTPLPPSGCNDGKGMALRRGLMASWHHGHGRARRHRPLGS
jgi:hypothetical protein